MLAKDVCDTLIYALYPKTGTQFLKWKYGLEPDAGEGEAEDLGGCQERG